MTEVISNILPHQATIALSDPSKDLETKCGEIFLLAKTNFWFACGFCKERFINVFAFINHIKDEHIPEVKVEPLQDAPTKTNDVLANNDYADDDHDEKSLFDQDADNDSRDAGSDKCSEDEKDDIKPKSESVGSSEKKKEEEKPCKEIEQVLTEEIKIPRRRGRKKVLYEPLISISPKSKKLTDDAAEDLGENAPSKDEDTESKSDARESSPGADKKSKKKYYRKKNIFPCPICKENITDGRSLKKHIRSHNEGGNENRFQCEECGKCYKNSFNLKTHSIIHSGTRPFKCEFCDVGFSHPNSLKTHRFLHTGDRPYKCDQCDKSFVSNSSRKVHMRQHTGETPYVCQYCGKGYTIKSNFDIHVRRHTGQRNFQCNQCNKGFFNKETLVNHIACHTGEKNFVCDVCSNRFSRRKDLVEHRKLHLDHKYYSCKVCGKEFSQYSGLYSHMRQHKNMDKDKDKTKDKEQ